VTEGEAILAAVLAEPDDDFHRLAYADWLEEQGDLARAEFIRVQTAHEWYPGGPMEAFRAGRSQEELAARGRELLDGRRPDRTCHWAAWAGEAVLRVTRDLVPPFRRGFVEEVSCACADWLRHGKEAVRGHPVRKVRLTDKWPRRWFPGVLGPRRGRIFWRWSVGGGARQEHDEITPALYEMIRPSESGQFDTREEAQDFLSDLCLRYASLDEHPYMKDPSSSTIFTV
jgi:uncharacterized protein (TIGR02996 family)